MNYLLDADILVAWGWQDHPDHHRVAQWISRELVRPSTRFLTSPIPQLGFVRVSVQRAAGSLAVKEACRTLEGMLARLGPNHAFIPNDRPATSAPAWCKGASRTTDAYLVGLADAHDAKLATLDTGIPGAFVVPNA